MKILVAHNYYQCRGGEDQCFEDEIAQLEAHGHEVIKYTQHNDSIKDRNHFSVALTTLWSRKSYREVLELIREHRPDVMHCTNTFPLISPSVYYAAAKESVPVVQALHNFRMMCPGTYLLRDGKVCEECIGKTFAMPAVRHRCYRGSLAGSITVASLLSLHRLMRSWKKKVHAFYTLTEFSKQKLAGLGVEPDRIVVKHNCVIPTPPPPEYVQRDYAVFAGRLSPEKGIDVMLDAWNKHNPPCKLLIVGDGPLADVVAEAQKNNPMIEWVGQKSLEEVLSLMGSARCLIMPSVYFETFGRTIIEAYSVGTPVVVSRFGAMQELVRDGVTGKLFERGDSADLIRKVNEVISDPELHESMKRAARIEFENNFTADHNFQKLLDIYELAISNAQTGDFGHESTATETDLVELTGPDASHGIPSPHMAKKPAGEQEPTQEEVGSQ